MRRYGFGGRGALGGVRPVCLLPRALGQEAVKQRRRGRAEGSHGCGWEEGEKLESGGTVSTLSASCGIRLLI